MEYVWRYAQTFLELFVDMAPYLLLGFLFAGILHAFFRQESLTKHLGKPGLGSSLKAAVLGVPLPLCSCGVIPTGLSLQKHGASKGATVSFLISTPQTGMDSILATSALMGWPMAVFRPIVAFITGVLGGWVTDSWRPSPSKPHPSLVPPKPSKVNVSCASGSGSSCGCSTPTPLKTPASFMDRLQSALHYGFVEMLSGIAKWLLIGLSIAALISLVVPDDFFSTYLSNYWLSVLLVLIVSVPLYVCATGSIPIALALMLKGMSPGVAFVFLMAGPATMASTIAVVGKALGRRTLLVYLGAIVVGAVFFGFVLDSVLPAEWFVPPRAHAGHAHDSLLPHWFEYVSAGLLAVLLLYSFYQNWFEALKSKKATPSQNPLIFTPVILRTYSIETITCNNCKRHLEKDVGALAEVVRVTASVADSTLTVEGNVPEPLVKQAVERAGYTVVKIS